MPPLWACRPCCCWLPARSVGWVASRPGPSADPARATSMALNRPWGGVAGKVVQAKSGAGR
jgi:hypothetical protein